MKNFVHTLCAVSKCHLFLYLNVDGLQEGPGKNVFGGPGIVLEFFVSKSVGTLIIYSHGLVKAFCYGTFVNIWWKL